MQIYVRDLLSSNLRIITLRVEPTDTVMSLMEQLEERTGVPPILQRLTFGCRSLYHTLGGTLADLDIVEDRTMTLTLRVSGCHELVHKTLKARGVDVGAPPPPQKMQIVVEDEIRVVMYRQKITLDVEASDTVASVMAQVQRRLGYPPDLQELCHEGSSSRFTMCHDSVGTLADYEVKNGSTLALDVNLRAAIAADVEERNIKKAKEIAAAGVE